MPRPLTRPLNHARRWGAIALTVLLACSGDSPTDSTPDGPATLTVAEVGEWSAGGSIPLNGLTVDPATADDLSAEVGGEPAHILTNRNGDLRVVLPLFLDETTLWSDPPTGPQSIVIRRGGDVIARTAQGVEIRTLEESPGSTMALLDDYIVRLEHFQQVLDRTDITAGAEEQHMIGLVAGLQDLLASTETGSLRDAIVSATSDELRLTDAMIAGCGFGEEVDEITSLIAGVVPPVRVGRGGDPDDECGIELDDETLARMMQFSVFLDRFGNWFLADMAGDVSDVDWGIGLMSLLGIMSDVPIVGTTISAINAYFALLDLIVNTYLTAWLPTVIDDLTLTAEETTLEIGDVTSTTKRICARNSPPPLTLTDVIGQMINVMGLIPALDEVEEILQGFAGLVLDKINGVVNQYASENPELALDVEFYSMPLVYWTAELDDPRFLVLLTGDDEIVEPVPFALEWEIPETADVGGDIDISYRPSTAPEAIILENLLGLIEYNAGAFGESIVGSDDVTITVVRKLVLDVTFADTITLDGSTIGVDAYFRDDEGVLIPEPNVAVVLNVVGGTADDPTGSTDIAGYYSTLVRLASGSNQVTVEVQATAATGESSTETVTAAEDQPDLQISIAGVPSRLEPDEDVQIAVTVSGGDGLGDIQVSVNVDGGEGDDDGWVSGSGGTFTTTARMSAFSNELEVEATATSGTQNATATETALRTNSIEILSRNVFLRAYTGASVCVELDELCPRHIESAEEKIDTSFADFADTANSAGNATMEGMSVNGNSSISVETDVSLGGGQFSGATFTGECDHFISLSNPNHEVHSYGAASGSWVELNVEFMVWGEPATFDISGSGDGSYDVEVADFECDSYDGCVSPSGSGVLEGGEDYDLDVAFDSGDGFNWQEGCADCGPDSGSQSGGSSVSVTFSVTH